MSILILMKIKNINNEYDQVPPSHSNTLSAVSGSIPYIISVFLQKDKSVFSMDTYRRRDIVIFLFQFFDNLMGGFIIRLSVFNVKFSHYFVQTKNGDPCIVGEIEHAPTNCRRWGDASLLSCVFFIRWNELFAF